MLEGTYRFIRNEAVSPAAIRKAGFEYTVEQARNIPELLALEDTTSLSYKHQVASELGKLGKTTDKSRGWWVQSVVLLHAGTYQTVGLLEQEWWCRPDNSDDADEKESGKWADASYRYRQRMGELMSRTIGVYDREADIFEFLLEKHEHEERYVIRGKTLRNVHSDEGKINILTYLQQQGVLGSYELSIPQKGMKDAKGKNKNRPARKASIEIKTAAITFTQKQHTMTTNAVLAEEVNPPKGEEPLRWLLLTCEPVDTLEQARRVVRIYTARWRIEDFHKAWKTGAGAERQRMTEPDHLERAVSILAFIGIRLLQLRESFTLPLLLKSYDLHEEAGLIAAQSCEHVLTQQEWKMLLLSEKKKRPKLDKAPSLQWAYKAIAKLGGFTDSKRTGIAGWDTLWKGWDKLQERVQGMLMAKQMLAEGIDLDEM